MLSHEQEARVLQIQSQPHYSMVCLSILAGLLNLDVSLIVKKKKAIIFMLDLGIQDQGLTESVVIKECANGLYSL